MYRQTITYSTARKNRARPVILAFISSTHSQRVYSTEMPTPAQMGTSGGVSLWDGTRQVGGGLILAAIPTAEWGARVLSFGSHHETLAPQSKDLLMSLAQTEISSYSLMLDNSDSHFSALMSDERGETFLFQVLEIYQGFVGCVFADFQKIFEGIVSEVTLTNTSLRLVAEWKTQAGIQQEEALPVSPSVIYIADASNDRIQTFDIDGGYLDQWGSYGSGNGQFDWPANIVIDASGNIYVADMSNHRIQKFDSIGGYLDQFGGNGSGNGKFSYPEGIAIDASGNIYVVDRDNNRIQKFDSIGGYLDQWGSSGSGNGEFNWPMGIVIDASGNIYVADSNNHRIQKFDSTGNYFDQWGSSGSGNGEFNTPTSIAIDASGNIYVADRNNHRIQKFDSIGGYLDQWGSSGSGNGEFNASWDISFDLDGTIYVVDRNNDRIQKFDSAGGYLDQWGSSGSGNGEFSYPEGIAIKYDRR